MTQLDTWTGCYDQNWKNLITPAAFSHPAKFSHGLIKRIYDHALQDGLIQPGGVVLDPFGGVGLGALYAMQNGLHWVGVELEPKFVELGRENIALWNARYAAHFPNWGTAQILQGDSRRLCEVVSAAGLVVSSPPYAEMPIRNDADYTEEKISKAKADGKTASKSDWGSNGSEHRSFGYGSTPGQLATLPPGTPPTLPAMDASAVVNGPAYPIPSAVISSPPFAGNTGGRGEASRNGINPALFDRHSGGMKKGTGDDPANLDHLPMGSPPVAIVSSPPYATGEKGHPSLGSVNKDDWGNEGTDIAGRRGLNGNYGETNGQLGAMKAGAAVIGSPPFENTLDMESRGKKLLSTVAQKYGNNLERQKDGEAKDYGSTDGQIGATQGQTFWEAARLIVEQCALLLPVGGAAIFVVKGYIKNGKYVDFPGQWQQLCEACGFETVHIHRAMLVKENGEQATMAAGHDTTGTTTNLLGEEVTTAGKALANRKNTVARKSFFRRLHERRRPDLAIDWETVLCMRKAASPKGTRPPGTDGGRA